MADNYFRVSYVPSRFVPYPELKNQLFRRPLLYGEVTFLADHWTDFGAMVQLIRDEQIIKGLPDIGMLTMGDFLYIYTEILHASFEEVMFTMNGPCTHCGEKTEVIQIMMPSLNGTPEMIEKTIKSGMTMKLSAAEIVFLELEEDVVFDEGTEPVLLVRLFDGTESEVDFFRVRHFEALNNMEEKVTPTNKLMQQVGLSIDKLESRDVKTLEYAASLLEHGPSGKARARCKVCNNQTDLAYDWRAMKYMPFRADKETVGNRIRFGKRVESVGSSSAKPGLPKGRATIPKIQ